MQTVLLKKNVLKTVFVLFYISYIEAEDVCSSSSPFART